MTEQMSLTIDRCRELARTRKHIAQNIIAIDVFGLLGIDKPIAADFLHRKGNPVIWHKQHLEVDFAPFVELARSTEQLESVVEFVSHVHNWNNVVLRFGDRHVKLCSEDEDVRRTILFFFEVYADCRQASA